MKERICKIMALYNTTIAGGFGLLVLLLFLVPGLSELLAWRNLDGTVAALLIPLFITLGGYTFVYRNRPAELKPVFIIQIIYKPIAILLLLLFTLQGLVHPIWAVLISAALVIYIIGHSIALKSFRPHS